VCLCSVAWFIIRTCGAVGLLRTQKWNLGFPNQRGLSWISERLSAFQEGLCFMEPLIEFINWLVEWHFDLLCVFLFADIDLSVTNRLMSENMQSLPLVITDLTLRWNSTVFYNKYSKLFFIFSLIIARVLASPFGWTKLVLKVSLTLDYFSSPLLKEREEILSHLLCSLSIAFP
jgi:hypothetical protein